MNEALPPKPVSAALRLPGGKLGDQARHALAAVDRVHADGELPVTPLDRHRDLSTFEGQYRFKPNSGRALGIGIDPDGPVPEFAVLHEVGHFLDHQAIGKPGTFASRRHPSLAAWRRTVDDTGRFRRLRALDRITDFELAKVAPNQSVEQSRAEIKYLLRYTEAWARSYAQYVVVKSQDHLLLEQLADELAADNPISELTHWEDDDFAPVIDVIDRLFEEKGWFR